MALQYVTIGDTQLHFNNKVQKAVIDHQIDEESEYTGCYKVTLEDGTIINVEVDFDGNWTEKDKGATEIAQTLGTIIEQYQD